MPELYTIGYEGIAQPDLFQTLIYHDIQTLLDIRELPQSRKPGLSKTALGLAAAGCGLQYAHIRALGTPRDIRYRRKIDHDEAAFQQGFLEYLATQDEAMAALTTRAGLERCCLLCYEADARQCHRWFVGERAVEMSGGALSLVHLAAGAGTIPAGAAPSTIPEIKGDTPDGGTGPGRAPARDDRMGLQQPGQ